MLTEASTYDELYRNFRWDIPDRFNIAVACCDRHADGTNRLALVYVVENGATTHTSFDEVAEASRRFANVLKADGLSRGDRMAVFLSQSLELPVAHLAAFRSGMISIPLFALFGEDALEFRLSNSEAKAIVDFLRNGRHLDVGILTGDEALKPQLDSFMKDHKEHLGLGFGEATAVVAGIAGFLFLCSLLWELVKPGSL